MSHWSWWMSILEAWREASIMGIKVDAEPPFGDQNKNDSEENI